MDGGEEAESSQRFLEGADVLLDAITQASRQGAVCGLGDGSLPGAGVVVPGDEGQGMSWHSHQNSRAQNLGSPGPEHQRTSMSTFVGGNHCRSMVELLGSVDGVVAQGQWRLEGVAELVLGEGKVDAEVELEVDAEVDGEVDVEVDEEVDAVVDVKGGSD